MSIDVTPQGLENMLEVRRYFAHALDPIHVGTGGERLSRVDMAIIREAGSDLPKLPGTSLSGACRAYAALRENRPQCAGQGQPNGATNDKGHCGEITCPVCQTFGYAKGGNAATAGNGGGGKKGVAQFAEAHIVAFPVASPGGTIWVTCADALKRFGYEDVQDIAADAVRISGRTGKLALGWLALRIEGPFDLPAALQKHLLQEKAQIGTVALVANNLFSAIVNDNLEVRTSVSIEPLNGAAEDGALFTYEAIPTGTLFAFDITWQERDQTKRAQSIATVTRGLQLFEWLGVGGMNTRGMGRLRVLGLQAQQEENTHG